MDETTPPGSHWYNWLLLPLVIPVAVIALVFLWLAALCSIPYYAIYPDRYVGRTAFGATRRQHPAVVKWLARYSELTLVERISRAWKIWRRSKRHENDRDG